MTDLQQLEQLLNKADCMYDIENGTMSETDIPNCATVLRAMHGYRCHFEAEFDEAGNILSIGQWEDM